MILSAKRKKLKESGQALIIVILTMVVALTVGLSVATRSITTVRISTSEEESSQAFSAAEAGIEEVLKSNVSMASENILPNNARYQATLVIPVSTTEFLVPALTLKDDTVQIWLSNYPDYSGKYNGSITLFWGDPGDSCPNASAIEVILFSGTNVNNPGVNRFALDPCTRGNNFTFVSGGSGNVGGVDFRNSYSISVSNGIILRIIPLYKNTNLAVRGTSALPSQGKDVTSTGKVTSGQGDIVRKIRVFQLNPALPYIFDHAIFSGTNL